jgi:hypothetical protein
MFRLLKKTNTVKAQNFFSLELIEKRWETSNIQLMADLGFDFPPKYFDWLVSRKEHAAKCSLEGDETLDFWPLDEDNFKYTSKIAGFLSITIGVFSSGSHVIMALNGPPSKVMFIDNDGSGNQIYLITTYEKFFSSLS